MLVERYHTDMQITLENNYMNLNITACMLQL